MKKIILKDLRLINFKGIVDRTINFSNRTDIFGANESGKSTTYSAFNWLLTGKDEFDRKDYEIKNTVRKELNSQPHEVQAILSVNGKDVTIKRVYSEKWVKPKGESQKVFEGHKTEFWVDDVPCNATEYDSKINDIISSKIIKLVTNPYFFNALGWQEQRRGLLAIAGDITDTEVIDTIASPKNDYGALINILNGGKTLEDWKSQISAKKGLLKKKALEYGPRIEEVKRGKPEPQNWELLQGEIDAKKTEISTIDTQLTDASETLNLKNKGIRDKQATQHSKEMELSSLRQKIKTEFIATQGSPDAEIPEVKQKITAKTGYITSLKTSIKDQNQNLTSYQNSIGKKTEEIAKLRTEWDLINSEKFEFDAASGICPTCKQALPDSDVEGKKNELLEAFNTSVLSRKQKKVDESNQLKTEVSQLQEKIAAIEKDGVKDADVTAAESELDLLTAKLQGLNDKESQRTAVDIEDKVYELVAINPEAVILAKAIGALQTEIIAETNKIDNTSSADLRTKKAGFEEELRQLEKKMGFKAQIDKADLRITELETEESANAQEIADLEQQEFDVETFTRAKMDILEKRVNSKFKLVKFRMFQRMVNGGIDETCVCEYKGVPYPTLNTAGRLIAGIDVLSTLSSFYEISAPVFCDCRESVTEIPETGLQIISLYVSPEDKEIRVVNK